LVCLYTDLKKEESRITATSYLTDNYFGYLDDEGTDAVDELDTGTG
jgi:hypothetical protein